MGCVALPHFRRLRGQRRSKSVALPHIPRQTRGSLRASGVGRHAREPHRRLREQVVVQSHEPPHTNDGEYCPHADAHDMPRRDDPEHNAEDDAAAVDDILADADGLSHAIGNRLHDAIARVGHEPLIQVHRCAHARERDAEQQAQRLLPKLGRVGQQRAEHVEEARDRKRQRNLQKVDGPERTSLEHVLDQRDDDVGDHRRIAEVEAADNRDDVGNRDG